MDQFHDTTDKKLEAEELIEPDGALEPFSSTLSPKATVMEPSNTEDQDGEDPHAKRVQSPPSGETLLVESPSKRTRVRKFARRTRDKTKQLLNIDDVLDSKEEDGDQSDEMDEISADPAFSPAKLLDKDPPRLRRISESELKADLRRVASRVATAVVHPRQNFQNSATRTAAGQMSKMQRPFLSAEQDRKLLDAHDKLAQVTSSRSSVHASESGESGSEERYARSKVERLEAQRTSLKVAWTIGRHVDRVRVVKYDLPKWRPRSEFIERDPSGQERFRWERWLAHLALYHTRSFTAQYVDDFEEMPFDVEHLSRIVERLAMISAPWQAWLISVRQIYRWQDPVRTGKYAALFWSLWYTEHIMGFFYAYVIYMVLLNRFYPTSVESIRKAMKRGMEQEARAHAWSELVQKHGRKDWVEPLLDELGPSIQMQLGDLASLLEVLTNFYRWEARNKTAATLFFFFCCLLITLLTDMRYCMKIIWFLAGGMFFFCWPIATNLPKYRYLVDFIKWPFWDIPTNAEWSITVLQEKALIRQANYVEQHETDAESDDSHSGSHSEPNGLIVQSQRPLQTHGETFKFRVLENGWIGRLTLDRCGMQYREKGNTWYLPYSRLIEMRKTEAQSSTKIVSLGMAKGGIEIVYTDDDGLEQLKTWNMPKEKRDELFSLLLGWSNLKWKVVQMERHSKRQEGKSILDGIL